MMGARRTVGFAASLLLLLGPGASAGAGTPQVLPLHLDREIRALQVVDANHDGLEDLLVVDEARRIHVWTARRGGMQAGPTWSTAAPTDAAFLSATPHGKPGELQLVALGAQGLMRLQPETAPLPLGRGAAPQHWRDPDGIALARFMTAAGSWVLPTASGWRWTPPGGAQQDIPVQDRIRTESPGPFLADRGRVTRTRPRLWPGRALRVGEAATPAGPAAWVLETHRLRMHAAGAPVDWPLPPVPQPGTRVLCDLDADGVPEVMEGSGSNQEGFYSFARARLDASGQPTWQALSRFHLGGYQLDPEWVDLDGDGRLDIVLTTIPIHGANMLRTITSGAVRVAHHAFLQRDDAAAPFAAKPDAVLESEIEVRIRFTFAGTIKVERSMTLVVDADVDGDGRLDLVRREGPDRLMVHLGTSEGVWAKTGYAVPIPSTAGRPETLAYSLDADGDGKDEVVLIGRGSKSEPALKPSLSIVPCAP